MRPTVGIVNLEEVGGTNLGQITLRKKKIKEVGQQGFNRIGGTKS